MASPNPDPTTRIIRLVGIYDASGTLRGEIAYWVGAKLGRRHCALCEITHGSVRERPEWRTCTTGLPVPFDTYHRDDQPDAVRIAAAGQAPVVVAETAAGHLLLLTPDDLTACDGSTDRLITAIEQRAAHLDLEWTASDRAETSSPVTP